ncbi:MAG: FixH family protein [Pseudomonadota bacterium]
MTQELKGHHVLFIALTAFGIIIAANLAMLFAATGSFPGLVVKNTYVASQGWNAKAEAQKSLGWSSEVSYLDGTLIVAIEDVTGRPLGNLNLIATAGRPGTDLHDKALQIQPIGDSYLASTSLSPGLWKISIKTKDEPAYQQSAVLHVPGER